MGKGYRQGRLGEEIRKIISELLLREIKDPRLSGMVSISAVEVTADGSYATAYVSVLGLTSSSEASEEEKEEVLAAFRSAKGLIKREIGKQIKLRHVPEVLFKMDTSMEYGRHITRLIHDLGIEGNENDNKDDEDEE
ncbi:MAG: 30S ribosome-binding factor RbfA [Peptostreptococcaceae bacterium]|nr:30S ribosome-binding factor RbfA [Peptostreptococcaceae bacterium]HZK60944.1 30S ribosome-binding factor RbfA [Anaerovoracaceae bacterium]